MRFAGSSWFAVSLAAAVFLASGAAEANEPCPEDGSICALGEVSGRCVTDSLGELSCLADPLESCSGQSEGGGCATFVAAGGACAVLDGRLVCVPSEEDERCDGLPFRGACETATSGPGVCLPSGGLLTCIDDPDGCAAADQESDCTTVDGEAGWCRGPTPSDPKICTGDCVVQFDDVPCRLEDGELGLCQTNDDPGAVYCLAEGEQLPGECSEGSACTNDAGEQGVCRRQGGEGSLGCSTGDGDSASCCLGSEPSMAMKSRHAAPAWSAISLLGLTLLGRRARRQRPRHPKVG